MQKIMIVATREFSQRIRQRGFLIMSIGTPLVFIIIALVVGAMSNPASRQATAPLPQEQPAQQVGYVDLANLIQTVPEAIPADMFQPLATVQEAETALSQGDIDAYFVIAADYRQSGAVRRVSERLAVNPPDVGWFNRLLLANLLPGLDPAQFDRLRRPFHSIGGPEFVNLSSPAESVPRNNSMLPLVVTLAIIMPLFTNASYLFQSMSQEKSSRVMEILLASLHPRQLLGGKLLGLGALTGVQYLLWGVIGGLAVVATGYSQRAAGLLAGVSLSLAEVVWLGLFALGGFFLYAALMAGLGALARDVEDGRIWLFVISLPLMIPIYFWAMIASNPDGPLAVALSLFPFSAPVAMLMRLTGAVAPIWQIALSLVLLFVTALATIWVMARLYRVHTLLSGESISMRRVWATLTHTL